MMKKVICIVLCLSMMFACSALAYDGTAPVTEETKTFSILTTNTCSKQGGFETMTWWQEVLKKANIELDMEYVDDSVYSDVVKPRLAAGVDLADIVMLPGADSDMSYCNSGLFVDLAPYYEADGYNMKVQFERLPGLEGMLKTPDGGMYYVPHLTDADVNMRCMMVNKQYLDVLGMTMEDVATIDGFTEYLRAVKANDCNGNGDPDDEIPLFMRAGMIQLIRMYFGLEAEGWYMAEDGAIICSAIDDRYKEFLEYCNMLYTDGLLYNEYNTANLDVQKALFASNQTGSMVHFVSNCTGYSSSINPDWKFNVDEPIMVPYAMEGKDGEKIAWGRNFYSGGGFGITTTCDDPELAFCFLDYMMSAEVGIDTWYGIEGVDYNIVDGDYVFTDVYYDNVDNYRSNMGYNCGCLPNGYQLYDSKECNQVRAAIAEMTPFVVNPSVAYSYKLDDENEILNMYLTDLTTYFDENMTAFIMGTRSLEEWDSYVATAQSMGLSDVVAVYQASLDRAAN